MIWAAHVVFVTEFRFSSHTCHHDISVAELNAAHGIADTVCTGRASFVSVTILRVRSELGRLPVLAHRLGPCYICYGFRVLMCVGSNDLKRVADGSATSNQIQQNFGNKKRAQSPSTTLLRHLQTCCCHIIQRSYCAAKRHLRSSLQLWTGIPYSSSHTPERSGSDVT